MNYFKEYQRWLDHPLLEETLKQQLSNMTNEDIKEAFFKQLEFGTAGMRGIIGAGTNKMNIYNIRKATIGLASYINKKQYINGEKGIVICYDTRIMSEEFAKEAARVCSYFNIKVYLFKKPRPTPVLSFALRHLKAKSGIMITASHNPKDYNGYKIYNEKGGQYLPEENDIIVNQIFNVENEIDINLESIDYYKEHNLIQYVLEDIDKAYLKHVSNIKFNNIDKDNIKIVYSSLNGTGFSIIDQLLPQLGYKDIFYTKEQCIEDGKFPTCPSPNPENIASFKLSLDLAKKNNTDIVCITDPDADRLGIAVKHHDTYINIDGNDMGALITKYIADNKKIDGTELLLSSIVSSDLASLIAQDYNINVKKTLIGFKYIADEIDKCQISKGNKYKYLFGFEESYGSLYDSNICRDKDAIQATLILIEMTAFYKERKMTLIDVLNQLQQKYGYFKNELINVSLQKSNNNLNIIEKLKTLDIVKDLDVEQLEDYTISTKFIFKNNTQEKINLPTSSILKYVLSDGSWFCIRPSGTEPKLKMYICCKSNNRLEANKKAKKIKDYLIKTIDNLIY